MKEENLEDREITDIEISLDERLELEKKTVTYRTRTRGFIQNRIK